MKCFCYTKPTRSCVNRLTNHSWRVNKMNDIEQRVKKVVAEQLSINEADIKNESAFIEDLGADSLDTVELVMALEDAFKVEIPDDQQEKLRTVQDAIDFINANAN